MNYCFAGSKVSCNFSKTSCNFFEDIYRVIFSKTSCNFFKESCSLISLQSIDFRATAYLRLEEISKTSNRGRGCDYSILKRRISFSKMYSSKANHVNIYLSSICWLLFFLQLDSHMRSVLSTIITLNVVLYQGWVNYGPPSNVLRPVNNFSELVRVFVGISILGFAFSLQR